LFHESFIVECYSQVAKEKKGKVVDAKCRDLTNSAACEKGRANPGSVNLCDWHEVSDFLSRLVAFVNE